MDLLKDTIMIIGIPPEYHSTLCKWAAERNSKNPALPVKPEIIVEKVVLEYVDRIERMEANLKPNDGGPEHALESPGFDLVEYSQVLNCATNDENSL